MSQLAIPDTSRLIAEVCDFFQQNQRDLPWREDNTPYTTLVSEFMLQQTQVSTVLKYYRPFLQRFPTLKDLAQAPLEEVLTSWSGLGYYSRAARLHACAQSILELGSFPETHQELISLPGIGEYTSKAISSVAFSQPSLALDTNAIRVLYRVYRIQQKAQHRASHRWLTQTIEPQIHPSQSSSFTQGLMEIGSLLCTPRKPLCSQCPLQQQCLASRTQTQTDYPLAKTSRPKVECHWSSFALIDQGRVLLIKNPDFKVLKQMWTLPTYEVKPEKESIPALFSQLPLLHSARYRHTITFRQITVTLHTLEASADLIDSSKLAKQTHWHPLTDEIALPSLTQKALTLCSQHSFK